MAKAFEPFLKTMRELENEPSAEQRPSTGDAAINDTSVILAALARHGPTSLVELQKITGLSFPEFSEAVKALLAAGVIELEGPSGEEIARLAPPVASVAGG